MSPQGWQPIATAPLDGRAFLFCVAGEEPVYIGAFRRPSVACVQEAKCLCYLSYTDTREKTYFRASGMIRCGLEATHWMPLPAAPVTA